MTQIQLGPRFNAIATAILVLCAIVITALVVRQQFFLFPKPEATIAQPQIRELENDDWLRVVGEGDLSAKALVTIAEFYDFQCPFCRRGLLALEHVSEIFGDNVQIIRRHLPLVNIHPAAMPAAVAAECARVNDKFEAYHAALFKNQDSLSVNQDLYVAVAEEVGISNIEAFTTCLTEEKARATVEADMALARDLGISSTPTLVVNGTVYRGAQTPESLEQLVRSIVTN